MIEIKKQKITFFEESLLDFFSKVGRDHLPWRKKNITAYEVWVSEIMLQQTQVNRVIQYYNRFLGKFPNIESLAKATWEEFLPYYEGLGYYARGRNMLKAAQIIVKEYGGQFPREKGLLEKIPGIGPYTASAILSFAYGENHLAWDTNLNRVIGRFFFGSKKVDFDRGAFEKKRTLPARVLNAALMDFGSAICLARPKCEACMLKGKCTYFSEQGKREIQEVKQKRKEGTKGNECKDMQAIVFLHENHRKYFSIKKSKYAPFILPVGQSSRQAIKAWFLKELHLRVSVRPPHEKRNRKGVSQVLTNAQILSGEHSLSVFQKEGVKEWYTKKNDHKV